MYQLKRLSLKHWYLCTLEDIDFRGSIGMIGPTGAGKSSLLDAIQVAICGANHNWFTLNPSTDARSERKVIEYCLGYLNPKKDGGQPLRPACETIIALTFAEERPDGSVHHVSIGVVMTAREGESREVPISRFIAPGFAISASNWKGLDEDGGYVKNWDEISLDMKRGCPEFEEYRTSAERFVSDFLARMRPGARQPNAKLFLNAFFNALSFTPINNPTGFVRDFILERDDLDIDRVRDQVARWQEFLAASRLIEEKIVVLKSVTRAFENWGRGLVEQATQRYRMACAAVERRRLQYGTTSKAWNQAKAETDKAKQVLAVQKRELESAREELESKSAVLQERGIEGRLHQIETERRLQQVQHDQKIKAPVDRLAETLQAVGNLTAIRTYIPQSFAPVLEAAESAKAIMRAQPDFGWLQNRFGEMAGFLAQLKLLADLPDRLTPQQENLSTELADLRQRRNQLQENVKRAGQGASPLSGHTQNLMRLLDAEGIDAVPLCDVVEIDDESWQLAAEMLLGNGREALIVEPAHVKRAHDVLYRNRNSHGLHNCRLVKTTRTESVEARLAPNSIASILRSDNRHAAAYLATHLGSCRMAEDEAELEKHSRAIMRNGKATSALDYQVYRDRDFFLVLGRAARESSAAAAEGELAKVQIEIRTKQTAFDQLGQAVHLIGVIVAHDPDLETLAFDREELERKLRELKDREAAILTAEDRALAKEIEELKTESKERQSEIDEQNDRINALSRADGTLGADALNARKELRRSVRAKREAICGFDDEELQAVAKLVSQAHGEKFLGPRNPFLHDKLMLKGKPEEAISLYKNAETEAEVELRQLTPERLSRTAFGARSRMFEDYCQKYAIDRPYGDSVPAYYDYQWTARQLKRLEDNELREHLENVQKAEKEMTLAVKEDLLSRLTDKFGMLEDQLRALNTHLRKHRFTGGQIYKFDKKPDPAFDKIRRLALAVKENPDGAQAIIEKRHEDPLLREAMIELETYIGSSGAAGLEDYRKYYSFDLFMLPEAQADEETEKVEGRMSLSGRGAVGSGGETQAPFYVAMAASMAMAYYPGGHPGTAKSGMGLVLFDEAFVKLDVANTQALINFFADFGLQLMVAAPESERPTFTEVFDTITTVSKSAATKTVYIASDFPKERARRELAAINPNRKGVEGFRAELAAEAEAAD